MKKYQLTIICLFGSMYLAAQQQPAQKEVMHMTLPKGTEKIEYGQFGEIKTRKFDNQKAELFKDHVYKKDDLLIYYRFFSTIKGLRKSIENKQKEMVSLSQQKTDRITDDAKIVTFNNIGFSIIDFREGTEYYKWFFSDYDKDGNFINGFIQYSKSDAENATHYLNDLLPTMGFNN